MHSVLLRVREALRGKLIAPEVSVSGTLSHDEKTEFNFRRTTFTTAWMKTTFLSVTKHHYTQRVPLEISIGLWCNRK
jgi:hypothetical protein